MARCWPPSWGHCRNDLGRTPVGEAVHDLRDYSKRAHTLPALLVGLAVGLSRTSSNRFLRLFSRTYVEVIRNVPALVVIFVF